MTAQTAMSGPATACGLYKTSFAPGTRFFYVYTNSGREGQWEGVDVPELRHFVVPRPRARRCYRPIETLAPFLFRPMAAYERRRERIDCKGHRRHARHAREDTRASGAPVPRRTRAREEIVRPLARGTALKLRCAGFRRSQNRSFTNVPRRAHAVDGWEAAQHQARIVTDCCSGRSRERHCRNDNNLGAVIAGVVVDQTGRGDSAGRRRNRTSGSGDQNQSAMTDESGMFRFAGVPQGRHELVVSFQGFQTDDGSRDDRRPVRRRCPTCCPWRPSPKR